MTPFETIKNSVKNDIFLNKLIETKYGKKPIVLIIGPPKSGTTWLHTQITERCEGIATLATKDTELLEGIVSNHWNQLDRTKQTFTKKTNQRILNYHQSKDKNAQYEIALPPMTDVLEATTCNLYSIFLSPKLMQRTNQKTSSYFYVDVNLSLAKKDSLFKIKELFKNLNLNNIKIVMIIRDPVQRFLSQLFQTFRGNQCTNHQTINFLLESHFDYLEYFEKYPDTPILNHGNWIQSKIDTTRLPDFFWSKKIDQGSFFDECYEYSLIDRIYERYTSIFGKENVNCLPFEFLFKKENLSNFFNKLGLHETNIETFQFETKIGKGNYSFESPKYTGLLKNLFATQYSFIKN